MTRLKKWFIGDYLDKTDDVFEKARIELTYDYSIFFWVLGLLFYGNLIANGLWLHFYIITFACIALTTVPFILKYKQNLDWAGNWYVIQQTITSAVTVYIEEVKPEISGPLWTMSFIMFTVFIFGIKRGILRLLPFISIFIITLYFQTQNIKLDFGIPDSQQLPNQPFVALVPFCLCLYLLIVFMRTNNRAAKQIQEQKKQVEAKNKEITDSIHYSKRIQSALMPTEKQVEKVIEKLKSE